MSLKGMAMGLAHSNRFRGSAAFFALLLAASGAHSEPGNDVTAADAPPEAQSARSPSRIMLGAARVGQSIMPASKFSRRRPPFPLQ
jgi:hypothetical protein